MADLKALSEAIILGQRRKAETLTKEALDGGVGADQILQDALISGMAVVGEKMNKNEYYVPEVLVAAHAMKGCMEILRPLLSETGLQPAGRAVIGTVAGDLHDIGKNLVAMMLEGAGFQVEDLGVDVSAEKFVEATKRIQANLICLSALLTTTLAYMRNIIAALKEANVRDQVKVMIGGAAVTPAYAKEIGADGYAPDASRAVDKAKELLGLPVSGVAA